MPPSHPWLTDETLKEWREILDLLDRPEDHLDFSPGLLDAVRRNRMEALVHQRFAACGLVIPAPAGEVLKGAFYARRYFYERYRALALDLHARLSAAGVPCLFIKGLVVASWFYDPPWCRPFSDIDVVVPFEGVERGACILESLGFHALERRELSRREREYIHALEFVNRTDSSLGVELHHNLGVFSFRPNWYKEEPGKARSPRDGLPTLDVESHLLFLCAHLYYRHYTQAHLIWLHDIHQVLARHREDFNWTRFHQLALKTGWGRGTFHVLSALCIYDGWDFPQVCHDLEQAPSIQELTYLPTEKLAGFFAMGGHIPTWRGRLAFLLFHLCPPKVVMVQRYGIRHPSLWFLLYPYRWAHLMLQGIRWSIGRLFSGVRSK
jgi:hypothetical protein